MKPVLLSILMMFSFAQAEELCEGTEYSAQTVYQNKSQSSEELDPMQSLIQAKEVDIEYLNASSEKLNDAVYAIEDMYEEPQAFIVDTTVGTAARVGQTVVNVSDTGVAAIAELVTYAVSVKDSNGLPACMKDAGSLADNVDCVIQLPTKTITLTFKVGAEIGEEIVVGVFSVFDGVMGASSDFFETIAFNLSQSDSEFKQKMAMGFAIIGAGFYYGRLVGRVIFIDTIGGAFRNLQDAAVHIGCNFGDVFSELVHFRLGRAALETLDLIDSVFVESLHLFFGIVTLGQFNLKDHMNDPEYIQRMQERRRKPGPRHHPHRRHYQPSIPRAESEESSPRRSFGPPHRNNFHRRG